MSGTGLRARETGPGHDWWHVGEYIQEAIQAGELLPGSHVGAVDALAETYRVSATTVRRAIHELVIEGVLETRRGRGAVVAAPKRNYDPSRGFSEQALEWGGAVRTEVCATQWEEAGQEAARALWVRPAQRVWSVVRVQLLDEEPVAGEELCFCERAAQCFMGDTAKQANLFETLRRELGVRPGDVHVESVHATRKRQWMNLLEVRPWTALLDIRRVICSKARPLVWSHVFIRGDRFGLRVPTGSFEGR